ncbi:MAG: hypothetical protein D6715_05440 [Calditrichaeota bacterium]|nr:MAG: hypothetical protein D6715_05440 [Calditrichota bacterium]
MKKIWMFLAGVFFLVLMVVLLAPLFFQGTLKRQLQTQLSEHLNASVGFTDLGVSLLRHFPDLSLQVEGLTIVNRAPFAGDTLLAVEKLSGTVDLWPLVTGGRVVIRRFQLNRPRLYLRQTAGGQANWQIAAGTAPSRPSAKGAGQNLSLAVERYDIRQAHIVYQDELSHSEIRLAGLDHGGHARLENEHLLLDTRTHARAVSVKLGGMPYLNRAELDWQAVLDVFLPQRRLTFQKNLLRLNALKLAFEGLIAAPREDQVAVDLHFQAPEIDLADLLSLVPAFYTRQLESLESSGTVSFQGSVKGVYRENHIPAFHLEARVTDGRLKYPQLPLPIEQVKLRLVVDNPGTGLDATEVNLKQLGFRLRNNPFLLRLKLTHLVSDPYLALTARGKLNLEDLKQAVVLPKTLQLNGLLETDLQVQGALSSLQQKSARHFSARGHLLLSRFTYAAPDLPEPLSVEQMKLAFTPQQVRLSEFRARSGRSDLQARGQLQGLWAFVFQNQTLKGNLIVTSRTLDLNPWMQGSGGTYQAVALPAGVDFLIKGRFQTVHFQDLVLEQVIGTLILQDQTLALKNLRMRALGGTLVASGSYDAKQPQQPLSRFQLHANQLDIARLYQHFVTVQKFAPIARYLKGSLSGQVALNTPLDEHLTPLWRRLYSEGGLTIPKVKLDGFQPLNRLAEMTHLDRLRDPALANLNPRYEIKQGRFYLKPLKFKLEGAELAVEGSNGLQKDIDYTLQVNMPARWIQPRLEAALGELFKQYGKSLLGETIPFKARFTGTLDNPRIETDFSSAVQQLTEKGKSLIAAELEKRKKALSDQAAKELEKKKKELENRLKNKLKDLFKP